MQTVLVFRISMERKSGVAGELSFVIPLASHILVTNIGSLDQG